MPPLLSNSWKRIQPVGCDKETGKVEIGWPDNTSLYEGVLGKDIFASGATKNVYKVLIPHFPLQAFEDDTAVWLVEPHHTKAVWKFTGTLVYPSCPDKFGQTLSAFTHFVYELSGREMVLVDIQGYFSTFRSENYEYWILNWMSRIPHDCSWHQYPHCFWSNVPFQGLICTYYLLLPLQFWLTLIQQGLRDWRPWTGGHQHIHHSTWL